MQRQIEDAAALVVLAVGIVTIIMVMGTVASQVVGYFWQVAAAPITSPPPAPPVVEESVCEYTGADHIVDDESGMCVGCGERIQEKVDQPF